jgi:hypothetical protein
VPWARAYLASLVLSARLRPPAFGLNRRGYWRDFGTAPDDWIYNRALEYVLPTIEFTENDYWAHGGGDVVTALQSFAAQHRLCDRRRLLLVTEGLWGGFRHIEAARDFIVSTLQCSRFASRNMLALHERMDPSKVIVGMHVRLGDFAAPVALTEYRRVPNAALPMQWFCNIARRAHDFFGDHWQLLLISDGQPDQLRPLLDNYPCITTADLGHTDCSDVLALSSADLLVCSASTYSGLAAFLSCSPYLWFTPTLFAHPEGCLSTHGFAAEQHRPNGPTQGAVERFVARDGEWTSRAVPVDFSGAVPDHALQLAAQRRSLRQPSQGYAPAAACSA